MSFPQFQEDSLTMIEASLGFKDASRGTVSPKDERHKASRVILLGVAQNPAAPSNAGDMEAIAASKAYLDWIRYGVPDWVNPKPNRDNIAQLADSNTSLDPELLPNHTKFAEIPIPIRNWRQTSDLCLAN